MILSNYLDVSLLEQHLRNGLVDMRFHKSLPLRMYTFSKRTVYENAWDDVTTKCRGLIVSKHDSIVARPFEKFFNVDTDYRPETWVSNLPRTAPVVAEKLDGSLGILYQYEGYHGISTKGSFHSDQAKWATNWYKRVCVNPQWPIGYTPMFEIIAETVQHHVVHYHGHERIVLLALINNETGEEADYNTVYQWAHINGLETVEVFGKSLGAVLNEDRKNREGYVLSWPRPGQAPLKVKVKHPSFLSLQKVVHAATPKAILQALMEGKVDLLETWMGQTDGPIGSWVKLWIAKFNFKYGEVLVKSNAAFRKAQMLAAVAPMDQARKVFALYINKEFPQYARVCFALLDARDFRPAAWNIVEQHFAAELSKPFALETSNV